MTGKNGTAVWSLTKSLWFCVAIQTKRNEFNQLINLADKVNLMFNCQVNISVYIHSVLGRVEIQIKI